MSFTSSVVATARLSLRNSARRCRPRSAQQRWPLPANTSATGAASRLSCTVWESICIDQRRGWRARQDPFDADTDEGPGTKDPEFEQPPMIRDPPPGPPPGLITGPTEEVMDICDKICALNALDLVQLIHLYRKRTGITEEMLAENSGPAAGGGAGAGAAAAAPEEVKDAFDVKLIGFDAKSKIKVIKEVRGITGLGLKEAKELVEGIPKVLKKDLTKVEAEKLMEQIKAAGGECSID